MTDPSNVGPARGQRSVLVSGASRGIGRATALRLLADGHRVSLGLRQPLSPQEWLAASPEAPEEWLDRLLIHPYEARASQPTGPDRADSSPETWVAAALARWGTIDAVVHCAGIFSRVGLCFSPGEEAEIQRVLDVNLLGPWRLSRAAWPHLAAYSASKFALLALCQTMRNEGWHQGIRVTAMCPSWVNTEMAAAVTALPKQAMTQPEDLAASIGHLLSLPASAVPFEYKVSCQLEV
ncbi:MAG: SDR family NAD(P)-dependent oxidoreductase [Cyanobium sp. M30B3]|nr:MAG: SDR family NAD(P)-dependent oxidoreductase [Cyanobium sp. M30B3]